MDNNGNSYTFKVTLLGDIAVGKSSLINKYFYKKFDESMRPTIGFDIITKEIVKNNITLKYQIWDTSGEERFRSTCKSYIKNSAGIILVFDLTNNKSFENLPQWLSLIDENIDKCLVYLIGCKSDLIEDRKVNIEDITQFSEKYELKYYEISNKNDKGDIDNIFSSFFDQIYNNFSYTINNNNSNNNNKEKVDIIKISTDNIGNNNDNNRNYYLQKLYCCN